MKNIWNKYTRMFLLIAVSLLLTVIVVSVNHYYVNRRVETQTVLVPKNHLKPFESLQGKLIEREIPLSEIPKDALLTLDELEGEDWYTGEIGLAKSTAISKALISKAVDSKFGTSLALEKEKLLIGIHTDQVKSTGNMLKEGVLVNAYVAIKVNQNDVKVITPKEDPHLGNLLVRDHQNHEGLTTKKEDDTSLIPSVAILEVNEASAKALVKYQEEGNVYLLPTGVNENYKKLASE